MPVSNPLRYQLRCLSANLAAGVRLALGLSVELSAFRPSVAQFVWLTLLLWTLSALDDAVTVGVDGHFNIFGLLQQVFFTVIFVLGSLALARLYRRPQLALTLPVMLTAGEFLIDAAHLLITVGDVANLTSFNLKILTWWLFLPWFALMAGRCVAVALAPSTPRRMQRAILGGVLFTALILLGAHLVPFQRLWVQADEVHDAGSDDFPRVTSEQVWVEQPRLLDGALSGLKDQQVGVTDLYFVGFAAFAGQDVFRKDVMTAREMLDRGFHTDGHSIVLINSRRTLLDTPLATVSNLRATLEEIGKAIDPEEDIVLLYVSSHGSPTHEISVELAPLELDQLTPTSLHRMLVDSGIKWKIIVISACYSGGFIEPLKDEYTMVITAAQSNRASFGCGNESEATYFGEAYFNQALRATRSFLTAFQQAKLAIAEREKSQGMSPPSNPQIFVGRAIESKVKSFESELATRRRDGPG